MTRCCPHCKSNRIRPSRSGNARLPAILRLLLSVMRCHNCLKKHVRFGRPAGKRDAT